MTKFNKQITQALGYYVYALIDPFNKKIFYVGKASGNNRAFDHFKASKNESDKTNRIKEIRLKGQEPIVEILRYGMKTEKSVLEVEAAIIDVLGVENITNKIRGHGIEKGRLSLEEIRRLYGKKPIKINSINEKCIMFFINRTYSTELSEIQIYDATRQYWYNVAKTKRMKMSDGNLSHKIALSIYDSVVIRVYSIIEWYDAGTTLSTREEYFEKKRFEFVGNLLKNHYLLGKKLINANGTDIRATRQGYRYIN